MSSTPSDSYHQAVEEFVLLWGDMASAWGINKTMAQVHALLYAESNPLDADSIMEKLGISRGSVSMNLRNLLQWQLIHKVHYKGERREFYTAEKEVWTLVSTLIRERQQREIAPIRRRLEELEKNFKSQPSDRPESQEFQERIHDFTEFLVMFERFTDAMLPYINKRHLGFLKKLVKMAEAHQSWKERS